MDVDGHPSPDVVKNLNGVDPESKLHILLHSNQPPDCCQFPAIRDAISSIDGRLELLDGEISTLRHRLAQLEEDRDALSRSRNQHVGIFSPLRRMPPETLGEIFTWALPSLADLHKRKSFIKQSPWVLTHVCSQWRAIAISMPSLWSVVCVDCNYSLAAAEAQISRAQRLKIHFYGSEEREARPQVRLLRFLIQHSARWEELYIQLTEGLLPLLPSIRNVPSLRRVAFEWDKDEGGDSDDEDDDNAARSVVVDYLRTACHLSDLMVCRQLSVHFLPPINQLTRYHAHAPWDTHRGILSANLALVEAHINVYPYPVWPATGQVIQLSQLRRLYVSHAEVLQYLQVAILEQFTLYLRWHEMYLIPALDRFVADTSSTVRRLCLRGLPHEALASKLMNRCTSLIELAIIIVGGDRYGFDEDSGHATVANDLVELITYLPSQITGLHLTFEDKSPFDYGLWADVLESRWRMGQGSLRVATLCFNGRRPKPEPGTLEKLGSLRESGLDYKLVKSADWWDHVAPWMCCPLWY
ncbi:hypothetical protein FB45DRAFT_1011119 [Roridomyces roridus]|uniref:F-box domain-containing protein n=1 Tax=Roridomyces roridus TaxID=1738132 RepID=A0AAD7FAV1_9AGAR|nr:hypothetical protein FB45DRAFT_1011119 [Roridomyces roridus]